jgi:hypothetical protein
MLFPHSGEDSELFQKSLDEGSLNIKIASVLFVGMNDSVLSDAKHVVFQEPISGKTPVSSLVKHQIYFRVKGDVMIRRLQPESCDSLILHSMRETSITAEHALVEDTSTTVGHTIVEETATAEHALVEEASETVETEEYTEDMKRREHFTDISTPLQLPASPFQYKQSPVVEQSDQQPSEKRSSHLSLSQSGQSREFLDEAVSFKDLIKLLKYNKNEGMVEFFHVFDVGSHNHMNEILQVFVKNVSLCALVIDSSEATIHKQEVELLHRMSYASKAMVIEMCSGCQPSPENLASKSASLEHLSNILVESSSDSPKNIFPITLKEEGDTDHNIGASLLTHALSSSSKTFPFSWYLFGFRLRLLMTSRNQSTATVSGECMPIAEGLEMDGPTVEAALQHLMNHNIILYFRNILNNAVFLDVQIFSQVLEVLFKKATRDVGCFDRLIFDKVVASLHNNSVSSEHFFTLFIELMIIAHFDYGTTKSYFIPCWLTILDEKDRKETCSTSVDSQFSPLFCKCPSTGCEFITMLTAFLLNQLDGWKILRNSQGNPECLYKNCVKFNFEDRCVVTISFFSGYIEVYVKLEESMKDLHGISTTVLQGLEKVKLVLNAHQSFSFNMAFLCHCRRFEHVHTAPYNSDTGALECVGESIKIGPSSPILKWLKDNKSGIIIICCA